MYIFRPEFMGWRKEWDALSRIARGSVLLGHYTLLRMKHLQDTDAKGRFIYAESFKRALRIGRWFQAQSLKTLTKRFH